MIQPRDYDIRINETPEGVVVSVVHLSSGIERSAMRRGCTQRNLLDAVLEELIAKTSPQYNIERTHGPFRSDRFDRCLATEWS
jgi:hypothetical protein